MAQNGGREDGRIFGYEISNPTVFYNAATDDFFWKRIKSLPKTTEGSFAQISFNSLGLQT